MMKIKMELENRKTPLVFEDVKGYRTADKFFEVEKKGLTFFIKVDTILNAQVEYEED